MTLELKNIQAHLERVEARVIKLEARVLELEMHDNVAGEAFGQALIALEKKVEKGKSTQWITDCLKEIHADMDDLAKQIRESKKPSRWKLPWLK